jgi:hypothetical protein
MLLMGASCTAKWGAASPTAAPATMAMNIQPVSESFFTGRFLLNIFAL